MKTVLIAIDEFAKFSNLPIEILESAGFKILHNKEGIPLDFVKHSEMYRKADYVIAGLETYSEDFFQKFGSVKAISRVGVGVDCIDLNSASNYGVKIFITSDRPSVAVAELCVSNMISLLRHTITMSNDLKRNNWNPIQGKELRSCTVGVVGLGSIGKEVAKRVSLFGSKVIGYGRTWNEEFARTYDVDRKTIQEIFKESDIISIHLPLTSETKVFIDKNLIDMSKSNALIVNTSRAGVIDNSALAEAVRSKAIGGAAVDVFDEERDPYPYGSLENVILTPHIGSHTLETRKAMEEMAAKNLVIYDSLSTDNESFETSDYVTRHSVN